MTKSQHVYFDGKIDYKIRSGGLLQSKVEILNLHFCDSHDLHLVGNQLEWPPLIWLKHEQHKIGKMKQINIICYKGNLVMLKNICEKLFNGVEINYYNYNLGRTHWYLGDSLSRLNILSKNVTKNLSHKISIGTMRLNRYFLYKFFLKNNIGELYYPSLTDTSLKTFENQIIKTTRLRESHCKLFHAKRLFQDSKSLSQKTFNESYVKILQSCYINVVSTIMYPNIWTQCGDEKLFDTILCKTIPLIIGSSAKANLEMMESLGFRPYKGLILENDNKLNHLERYSSLLYDNLHFLSNMENLKELYESNIDVIEHNFKVLVDTDWEKQHEKQFNMLPNCIKENTGKYSPPESNLPVII
jgi:hypothetical protein